jgi:hypothetical protein
LGRLFEPTRHLQIENKWSNLTALFFNSHHIIFLQKKKKSVKRGSISVRYRFLTSIFLTCSKMIVRSKT